MPAKKKAARKKPSAEDRIAEYVDSPRMIQRLRHGKQLAATILGNYGEYRTQVELSNKKKDADGACTCPSDYQPCKHVYALRKTWDENPDSFFDLGTFLKGLHKQSNAYLINAIEQIALKRPETLSVFGVPGFEDEADEDEDEDEWDDGYNEQDEQVW